MNIEIKPPVGCTAEDLKIESKMECNIIESKVTYPNGCTVTSIIKGTEQTIIPSGELIDLGNGVYQVPN